MQAKANGNITNIWLERRTIVVYALSVLALAEIIDLTIVSVAIPHLMGALGANINEISLTMTSYIVAAAICIPLTGLIVDKFGMKNVALISVLLFALSSVLCGMATTLNEMIIFRIMQGIGGAFLPSLAQSYVAKHFSLAEQPKIMTVFTLCVVLGPIIGPIMGGYIVEHLNWRWIFYVNVPVCILGYILTSVFMDDKQNKTEVKIDYISFMFMAVGIGCLEYFVDEGNIHNWFDSIEMISVLAAALVFLLFFIWRGLLGYSVVNFKIFANKNFVLSCATVFFFFMFLAGPMSFFSAFLQQQYLYPVDTAGYLQAPRGVAAIIAAPIYLALSKKFDSRIIMLFAMLLSGSATLSMGFLSVEPDTRLILLLVLLQGFGMVGVFVLLMPLAFGGIAAELSDASAGVFNFFRNFSMSIGTAIASTIISRQQQVVWHDLTKHIGNSVTNFRIWSTHMPVMLTHNKVPILLFGIMRASGMQSYLDMFYMSGMLLISLFWLPIILNKPKHDASIVLHH